MGGDGIDAVPSRLKIAMLASLARLATLALFALTAAWGLSAAEVQSQEAASVTVGDFFFCERGTPPETCVTTVSTGDTVVWDYSQGTVGHTVTHCGGSCDEPTDDPLFDSGGISPGESFSVTFQEPGRYLYRCDFHPDAMRATIVVQAEETPTSTSTSTPASTPTATATPTPVPTDTPTAEPAAPTATPSPTAITPSDIEASDDDGVSAWWFVLAGVGGAAALATGAVIYARTRG